jgi:hypothetical protein
MPLDVNGNIIESTDVSSSGNVLKNKIITDGLVLYLDAANINSYPGNGSTWYDISGNGKNYTFGTGISWSSSGYFYNDGSGVFTGPASNTFGFNTYSECYVEAFARVTSATGNVFFRFDATNSLNGDTRAIFSHFYYSNGNTYFDVNGCCDVTQRISYANDSDFTTAVRHIAFRVRREIFPMRQIFKNTIPQVDSGTNTTATATWNLNTLATIASNWNGYLYSFKVYNRPLQQHEMMQNYRAEASRYGLS